MDIYSFTVKDIDENEVSMKNFKNKVILIVNTASECGFSYQLFDLEKLYQKYKDRGFVVLGFPCNQFAKQEPNSNDKIKNICSSLYNVTFPMFAKIDVNGKNEHPLFKFLKSKKSTILGNKIKWNFTKFLVDRYGKVSFRFSPMTKPCDIEKYIEKLLEQ
jgi:hypothetical protein